MARQNVKSSANFVRIGMLGNVEECHPPDPAPSPRHDSSLFTSNCENVYSEKFIRSAFRRGEQGEGESEIIYQNAMLSNFIN